MRPYWAAAQRSQATVASDACSTKAVRTPELAQRGHWSYAIDKGDCDRDTLPGTSLFVRGNLVFVLQRLCDVIQTMQQVVATTRVDLEFTL